MIDKTQRLNESLDSFLTEYKEKNEGNKYRPVAVGRYGIRTRESIYSKELAKDYSKNKLIFKNTLTVGMGSTQIDIGVLSEDATYAVSPAYHTYRIHDINSDYLRYCLECRNQDMFVRYVKRGSRQGKSIDLKRWITYKIPVYPESVQAEIVKRLDSVKAILSLREQELNALDDLIKARFVELFGDPVSNQHGYEKVSLSELADIKIGPFGSLLHKEDYIEGGHPLLNPSHIVDGKIASDYKLSISEDKYNELSAYQLHVGDVVMGRRGEMGRCAIVPDEGYLCGTGSLIIRTKGDVTADYIQKVISFPSFKKTIEDMAVGQTMPNLNVPIVSSFQIIKPPIEVQNRYYAFVAAIDKSKATVQKALDETQLLFDSLMQQYFG